MEAEPLSVGSGFKMKRGSGASDPHFNRGLSDGEAFECCNGSGTRHSPDHHSIGALQPHAVPYLRPIFPQRDHGSCPAHVALVRIEAKLGLEGPVRACRQVAGKIAKTRLTSLPWMDTAGSNLDGQVAWLFLG